MKPAAKYGIGIAALVVVLGGVGLFLFLRDDVPAEVSLELQLAVHPRLTSPGSQDGGFANTGR